MWYILAMKLTPKLAKILENHGWIDEFDLPALAGECGHLIVLIKFDNGKYAKCYLAGAAELIKAARDMGYDYDEMGFTIPMYDMLCAYFNLPNRYSTNKQVEMVN